MKRGGHSSKELRAADERDGAAHPRPNVERAHETGACRCLVPASALMNPRALRLACPSARVHEVAIFRGCFFFNINLWILSRDNQVCPTDMDVLTGMDMSSPNDPRRSDVIEQTKKPSTTEVQDLIHEVAEVIVRCKRP